jgi:hypothetical protein
MLQRDLKEAPVKLSGQETLPLEDPGDGRFDLLFCEVSAKFLKVTFSGKDWIQFQSTNLGVPF